jgi:colicin import membrane protein
MATETVARPESKSPLDDDPFYYGWRMVRKFDQDGKEDWVRVALTEWDILHPEEDDFVVHTTAHFRDCRYLFDAFEDILRNRPGAIVFYDMRIDWQLDEYSVFGPDIAVFENLNSPWQPERGTFPVKSMGAQAVVAVEVISPNTEKTDKDRKVLEYYRVGIPLYVIVDREEEEGQSTVIVYGYRHTPKGYVRIPDDPRGIWVEYLRIWIRSGGDKVVCFDEHGNRVPERPEIIEQRDAFHKERDKEKQRAEQEKQRAEQEKQRADENARKVAELEAELRRLRGESN